MDRTTEVKIAGGVAVCKYTDGSCLITTQNEYILLVKSETGRYFEAEWRDKRTGCFRSFDGVRRIKHNGVFDLPTLDECEERARIRRDLKIRDRAYGNAYDYLRRRRYMG